MNFKPITKIEKGDLLDKTTLRKLEKGFCPQCGRGIDITKFYSLVGRHNVISENERFKFVGKSGLPEIQTSTKYTYQGAYIPLCEVCYRHYKWLDKISLLSTILLAVGVVGTFASIIIYGVTKTNVSFGFPFFLLFMSMPFVFWFLKSVFLNSERFSRKTVRLNEEFFYTGVPDTTENNLLIVATSEELKNKGN